MKKRKKIRRSTEKKKRKVPENIFNIPADQARKIIENAFSNGVLFWIDTGRWTNRKKVSDEILEDAGLPKEALRATQYLVDRKEVRKVTQWIDRPHRWAREYRNSLPWVKHMRGFHFLRRERIDAAEEFMQECLVNMKESLQEFKKKLPKLESEFAEKFPKLYDPKFYPSAEAIDRLFRLRWGYEMISIGEGQVKSKVLSPEIEKREREKRMALLMETGEEGIKIIRTAFMEMVKHLRDRLKNPDASFKNSTIEKPKKFIEDFFGELNFLGDKPFEDLVKEAKDIFDGLDAQDLRDDEEYRKEMAEVTEDIVKAVDKLPLVKMSRDIVF